MKAILVEENEVSKTYRLEYTVEELANFRTAVNEMFKGTKYSETTEYSDEGCSIINAKEC
jgi:hypothetical protein